MKQKQLNYLRGPTLQTIVGVLQHDSQCLWQNGLLAASIDAAARAERECPGLAGPEAWCLATIKHGATGRSLYTNMCNIYIYICADSGALEHPF